MFSVQCLKTERVRDSPARRHSHFRNITLHTHKHRHARTEYNSALHADMPFISQSSNLHLFSIFSIICIQHPIVKHILSANLLNTNRSKSLIFKVFWTLIQKFIKASSVAKADWSVSAELACLAVYFFPLDRSCKALPKLMWNICELWVSQQMFRDLSWSHFRCVMVWLFTLVHCNVICQHNYRLY